MQSQPPYEIPSDYSNLLWREMDRRNRLRLLFGGSLVVAGLRSRSKVGIALATLGGGIAAIGYVSERHRRSGHPLPLKKTVVRRAITINAPQQQVYDFWSERENLVRVLPGVEAIEPSHDGRWKWKLGVVAPIEVTVETEAIESEPPKLLSWRSVAHSPLEHAGSLVFDEDPVSHATNVHFTISWIAAHPAFALIPPIVGKISAWHAVEALHRAKDILEKPAQ